MNGRVLNDTDYDSISSNNEITIGLENINKGIYVGMLTTKEIESFQTS
jgi:hypothetical protein